MKSLKTKKIDCTVSKALKVIGSKWTLLIIHNMCDGKKRFGELLRLLDGISPRTLSDRLQMLEKHGFVTKKVYPEVPLKVEYTLTEKGKSVKKIIKSLESWGMAH